jgi:hypothetical protein
VRADLFTVAKPDEAGVDNTGLPVAPVEGLQVVEVLVLVGPDEVVFVDALASLAVA